MSICEVAWQPRWQHQQSVIGCYIEHLPFEEPIQGSLATLRTTAISQLSNHNWYQVAKWHQVARTPHLADVPLLPWLLSLPLLPASPPSDTSMLLLLL